MKTKNPEQALLEAALKERPARSAKSNSAKADEREKKTTKNRSRAKKTAPVANFCQKKQPVVVCFGTMSISGDSLGPMVGTLLATRYNIPAFVYGTEQLPVNGKNMDGWLDFIRDAHRGSLFIAVDASLGTADKVGQIIIRPDGVCPAAIKGKKERFGDVGILAVVAENKGDALMQLMSVSQLYVSELADKVALLLKEAM